MARSGRAWRTPVDPTKPDTTPRPLSTRRAVTALALYALIAGLITVAGRLFKIPLLTDWPGNGVAMFVNAGIASICAGAAVQFLCYRRPRAAMAVGGITLLIGLATLLEHALSVDLRIDTVLFEPRWGFRGGVSP